MSEQPNPTQYDPDAPPEPEQHPQVVAGDETDVAFYGDQTPALLDDEEAQP